MSRPLSQGRYRLSASSFYCLSPPGHRWSDVLGFCENTKGIFHNKNSLYYDDALLGQADSPLTARTVPSSLTLNSLRGSSRTRKDRRALSPVSRSLAVTVVTYTSRAPLPAALSSIRAWYSVWENTGLSSFSSVTCAARGQQ